MLCVSISVCNTWLALIAAAGLGFRLITPTSAGVRWMVVPVADNGLFEDLRIVNVLAGDVNDETGVGREIDLNMPVLVRSRVNIDGLRSSVSRWGLDSGSLGHPCLYI